MTDRLTYLVTQVLQHAATADELQELSDLLEADGDGVISRQIEALLRQDIGTGNIPYDHDHWDDIASSILAADKPAPAPLVPIRGNGRWRWGVAACVALLLATGGVWYLLQHKIVRHIANVEQQQRHSDIPPGADRATLTLADGTEIPLDSGTQHTLARQGNTIISKPGNGRLSYQSGSVLSREIPPYNTLRTPAGGQFQLQLPDGSKVWLNAASSLRYPVAFTGNARTVELNGEAYFEIAANAKQPFIVKAANTDVQVLGTQFNVMAYEDETSVKTTLLTGAVKVNDKRLHPGQGASIDRRSGALSVQEHVNTEAVIAWKNGLIQLEGEDIHAVMRLIARWYDVRVTYNAPVNAHFRGIIPRNVPLSQVLKMLEMTGEVHFTVADKQIIVSP
ncbi:FecR domain-containing protein [Chitinophaga filiformis]|uniref:FecR family protein n=1 Tax=Chitinophaga filiformis TaxID=104663 RepID=UPI001F2AFC56|nr:FecR family protein [Chitinophaga filiformis]MCF6405034.1 FecR domain-containing protein [Chitinophaga filiformis]